MTEPAPQPPPPPPSPHPQDPYRDPSGELPVAELHHRTTFAAALATLRYAPVLILPAGLVLLGLSLLIGDWVWEAMVLFPFLMVLSLAATPILARLRKGGAVALAGGGRLEGAAARRALLVALGLPPLLVAIAVHGELWAAQGLAWLRGQL